MSDMVTVWKDTKEEVRRLWHEGQRNFFLLGYHLKQIRDSKVYIEEYHTFAEFLKTEDITEGTAYQLIRIVETFKLNQETSQTFPLSWKKAQLLTAAVRKNPKKVESFIAMGESHTTQELKDELLTVKTKKGETLNLPSYKITGEPAEIEIIKKGLETLSSTVGLPVVDLLAKIIKDELKKHGKAIKHQATETGKLSREFSDLFCTTYEKHQGTKYMFRGVIDSQLCKKIVQTFEIETLKPALDYFFTVKGKEKWWSGYTLGVFYSTVNEMVQKGQKTSEPQKYTGLKKVFDDKTGTFKYV